MIKLFIFALIYLFGNMPEEVIEQQDFLSLGVVDRVEGELAIILLENEEKELRIPVNRRIKEGNWLLIYWIHKQPFILGTLDNYEKWRQEKINGLHEELKQKQTYP